MAFAARLALALALAFATAGAAAAEEPEAKSDAPGFHFDVFRKDSLFGSHHITFEKSGKTLNVNVKIRFKVKFAFVTVYRYEHDNHEVWRDGRLIALTAKTDDNGTPKNVSVQAEGEAYRITANGRTRTVSAPDGLIPTSYWHPHTVNAERLLNTQTGNVMPVTIVPEARDTVRVVDRRVTATRYRLTSPRLAFDLWYDRDGCLAKIRFQAPEDKSVIDYRARSRLAGPGAAALSDHPLIGSCVAARSGDRGAST